MSSQIQEQAQASILAVSAVVSDALAVPVLTGEIRVIAAGVEQQAESVVHAAALRERVGGVGIVPGEIDQHADGIVVRVALRQNVAGVEIVAGTVDEQPRGQVNAGSLAVVVHAVVIVAVTIEQHAHRIPVGRALTVDVGVVDVVAGQIHERRKAAAGVRAVADGESLREGQVAIVVSFDVRLPAAGDVPVVSRAVAQDADRPDSSEALPVETHAIEIVSVLVPQQAEADCGGALCKTVGLVVVVAGLVLQERDPEKGGALADVRRPVGVVAVGVHHGRDSEQRGSGPDHAVTVVEVVAPQIENGPDSRVLEPVRGSGVAAIRVVPRRFKDQQGGVRIGVVGRRPDPDVAERGGQPQRLPRPSGAVRGLALQLGERVANHPAGGEQGRHIHGCVHRQLPQRRRLRIDFETLLQRPVHHPTRNAGRQNRGPDFGVVLHREGVDQEGGDRILAIRRRDYPEGAVNPRARALHGGIETRQGRYKRGG